MIKKNCSFDPAPCLSALALGFALFLIPCTARAQSIDFTESGFITTWMLLGPYTQVGAIYSEPIKKLDYLADGFETFESTFLPFEGASVSPTCDASGVIPCYTTGIMGNPNTTLTDPTVELVDSTTINSYVITVPPAPAATAFINVPGSPSTEVDTLSFDSYWTGLEAAGLSNMMAYAFTYVENPTDHDISALLQSASDDALQVAVNRQTVITYNYDRWYNYSNVVQDNIPVVLKRGVNLVMVKVFEIGGNWGFRLRFLDTDTCEPLTDDPTKPSYINILREPPAEEPVKIVVIRDLPATILPGDQVVVTLTVKVIAGSPGAAVIKETLPEDYPFVPGSADHGGVHSGGVITWNLPAPLAAQTVLTYTMQAPQILTSFMSLGTIEVSGMKIDIEGDAGFTVTPGTGTLTSDWIKNWLVLHPINQNTADAYPQDNPGPTLILDYLTDGSLDEHNIVPEDGLPVTPKFNGNGITASYGTGFFESTATNPVTTESFQVLADADGCIDFEATFREKAPTYDPLNPTVDVVNNAMCYAACYVTNPNPEALPVYIGCGSDDSIEVLLNGARVHANSIPRGFCAGAPGVQDTVGPVILKPGKNLVLVKVFEGGGGFDFAFRFQNSAGGLIGLPIDLLPGDYTPVDKGIILTHTIPTALVNGTSATLTIAVTPTLGAGDVTVHVELPEGLTASNPSNGGTVNATGRILNWNLGTVNTALTLTYTATAAVDAMDGRLVLSATLDGEPAPFGGDSLYRGSTTFNENGFIKMWLHLGPLAVNQPGQTTIAGDAYASAPGADLLLDWILSEDGTVNEADIIPYEGLKTVIMYGGNGISPLSGGTGARSLGMVIPPAADPPAWTPDQFPVWKPVSSRLGTIAYEDATIDGFDADDQVHLSVVYVTNNTGLDLTTTMGIGSDDSIQVMVGTGAEMQSFWNNGGRGYDPENVEQNVFGPVTLKKGENRVMVKVSDGCCQSGFRLRFRDPKGAGPCGTYLPGEPVKGLGAPDITLSLTPTELIPQAMVVRDFEQDSYDGIESPVVRLNVTARDTIDLSMEEPIPAGFTASDIDQNGKANPGGTAIVWKLFGISSQVIRYKLNSTCGGDIRFGQGNFSSGPLEGTILGKTMLPRKLQSSIFTSWDSRDFGPSGGAAQKLDPKGMDVLGVGAGFPVSGNEELRFVSIPRTGDFEFFTRIDCYDSSNGTGLAGIMVRNDYEPGSVFGFMGIVASATTWKFQAIYRAIPGSVITTATPINFSVRTLPIWVKVKKFYDATKQMERLQFFRRASDTADWGTAFYSRDMNELGDDVVVGLVVTGTGGRSLARFKELGGVPDLPPLTTISNTRPTARIVVTPPSGQVLLVEGKGEATLDGSTSDDGDGGLQGLTYAWTKVSGPAGDTIVSPSAASTVVKFTAEGTFDYRLTVNDGQSSDNTDTETVRITVTSSGGGPNFKRGDVDADGVVNITDVIAFLGWNFRGDPPLLACPDSADSDDSGDLNVTDAIVTLGWNFRGDPPVLPAPGPDVCGPDDTITPTPPIDICNYPPLSCTQ